MYILGSGWIIFSNFCEAARKKILRRSPFIEGNDDVEKCQSICTSSKHRKRCSGIEWYEKKQEETGARCILIVGRNRATHGYHGTSNGDASCYIRPGILFLHNRNTLCKSYTYNQRL